MIVPCPNCEAKIEVEGRSAGGLVECPQCRQTFDVPGDSGALTDFLPDAERKPRPPRTKKTCPMCGTPNPLPAAACRNCGEPFGSRSGNRSSVTRQSILGIASFVIAIGVGFVEFILFAVAGYIESTTPGGMDESSSAAILLGLGLIGGLLMNLLGIVLGVAGLFQRGHGKLFAAMGAALGTLILISIVALLGIGIAMG